MEIRVLGSNMEVGDSLTSYTKDHIEKVVKKYFENAVKSEVHFKKEGHLFKVLLIVNEGVKKGIVVKSDGEAGDAYGALNEATKKAENQLRRYHDRLKNYRHNSGIKNISPDYKSLNATKYVLPPLPYDVFSEMEAETNKLENSKNNHKVISEKTTEIETLELDEAIMKMDLANLPALVFINKNNGRMNVVYHRKDGFISLIDPQ
jgi:ribosomal subunit interface protein